MCGGDARLPAPPGEGQGYGSTAAAGECLHGICSKILQVKKLSVMLNVYFSVDTQKKIYQTLMQDLHPDPPVDPAYPGTCGDRLKGLALPAASRYTNNFNFLDRLDLWVF